MNKLTLSAPTIPIFWLSVALAVLALLGHWVVLPLITAYKFWVAILAFIVLCVGCLYKGW